MTKSVYITAVNGPQPGRRFELNESVSVMGRHPDCQIVVDVGAVSRQHATIHRNGGDVFLEDLGSRNGTYLNDERVEGRLERPLSDGDEVRVCDISFLVSTDAPPPNISQTLDSGSGKVVLEDGQDGTSTIMSKLEVSSSRGKVQVSAGLEAKLDALLEINHSLGKALGLDEVLPQVLNGLFKIFVHADRGFIVMRNDDGVLTPMWTKLRRDDADTIRISRTIVRQVMERREAILSADAADDSRFDMSESIADLRMRSMMCAPLIDSEGAAIGVLQIDSLQSGKRFKDADLGVLVAVATQAGLSIDNARMHEQALLQREVERDLEVAHQVQRSFLPQRPPQVDGYGFYDYYEPANHVGGDYYDYIPLPDGRLAVLVADVVGHGIAAALLMAKLSAEARFCLATEPQAEVAMTRLNDALTLLGLDRFVTMILIVLDPGTGEVVIANAGHMAPILRRANGELEEPSADNAGLPLGITGGIDYLPTKIALRPGEMMVLYTDGINECASSEGEMYGIDRMREIISGFVGVAPARLGEMLVDDARRFLRGSQQDDDMCLVCLGRA